jgi:hypothetical protein
MAVSYLTFAMKVACHQNAILGREIDCFKLTED